MEYFRKREIHLCTKIAVPEKAFPFVLIRTGNRFMTTDSVLNVVVFRSNDKDGCIIR